MKNNNFEKGVVVLLKSETRNPEYGIADWIDMTTLVVIETDGLKCQVIDLDNPTVHFTKSIDELQVAPLGW